MSEPVDKLQPGKLLKRNVVYEGTIVDLVVDEIEVKGRSTIREVVRHPGGVVVLGEIEPDRIPFVRQYRYPVGKPLLELPAGKIDPQEDPRASAAREFEEETGYRPLELHAVCSFYASPGYCDELLHLFYTDSVEKTAINREFDEEMTLEICSLQEAVDLIHSGEIVDAKTVAAVFWLAAKSQSPGQR
ncbi:MAG TPA: NUDIX hydrolase [Acidobacteriota bacterium]|nr:NUDIX hydrolase [Acidobacteriota bacterium]